MEINLENIKEVGFKKVLNYKGYQVKVSDDISYLISLNYKPSVLYEEAVLYSIRSNGLYRLVKLNNGMYAYMDINTDKLLPYRFNFATNFLDNGLVIVAVNEMVSYINLNMEYLTTTLEWKPLEARKTLNQGFKKINLEEDMPYVVGICDGYVLEQYLMYDENLNTFSYCFGRKMTLKR